MRLKRSGLANGYWMSFLAFTRVQRFEILISCFQFIHLCVLARGSLSPRYDDLTGYWTLNNVPWAGSSDYLGSSAVSSFMVTFHDVSATSGSVRWLYVCMENGTKGWHSSFSPVLNGKGFSLSYRDSTNLLLVLQNRSPSLYLPSLATRIFFDFWYRFEGARGTVFLG